MTLHKFWELGAICKSFNAIACNILTIVRCFAPFAMCHDNFVWCARKKTGKKSAYFGESIGTFGQAIYPWNLRVFLSVVISLFAEFDVSVLWNLLNLTYKISNYRIALIALLANRCFRTILLTVYFVALHGDIHQYSSQDSGNNDGY